MHALVDEASSLSVITTCKMLHDVHICMNCIAFSLNQVRLTGLSALYEAGQHISDQARQLSYRSEAWFTLLTSHWVGTALARRKTAFLLTCLFSRLASLLPMCLSVHVLNPFVFVVCSESLNFCTLKSLETL